MPSCANASDAKQTGKDVSKVICSIDLRKKGKMMRSGELTRASITNAETGGEGIQCLFNPTEYTIAKTINWQPRQNMGKDVPVMEFTGGGSRSLSMELFFDTYEAANGNPGARTQTPDVRTLIDRLWKLTMIDERLRNQTTGQGRPPMVIFQWGAAWSFKAVITQLSVRYVLFQRDGTPVRAIANVTFQEAEDEKNQPGTNPTSESLPGYRRREIRPGDTLALIAFEEYGDPTQWRRIADENTIENPMDLSGYRVLGIPPAGGR